MKSDFVVISNGVMLIPIFMAIAAMVKNLKGENTDSHRYFLYEKESREVFW
jgi:hypothetical protein